MIRKSRWLSPLLFTLLSSTAFAQSMTSAQAATAARADIKGMFGFVPKFLNDVPDVALPGAWEEMKTLQLNPKTALPGKIKELIGLAVAAQVPCKYCTYVHTQFAKLNGASDAEVGEAVMMAALARHWSTVIQGNQTNFAQWRAEVASWIAYAKKQASGQVPAAAPVNVTDAASAMQDMQQSMGSVPEFATQFPPEALAGAWKEDRDVEMSPHTALSGKNKSLIGLAVSAQVPCKYCIEADTQFARLQGATDQEIHEAVAMAALTRHWSTYLNGTMADEAQLRRDVDRLVKGAKKMMAAPKPTEVSQAAPAAAAAPKPMAATHGTTPALRGGAAMVKPGQAMPEQSAKPTGQQ